MNISNTTGSGAMDVENSTESRVCETPLGQGIAMITLNIAAALLGTIGNLLVCGSVLTTHWLRTIPNLILVSLAVADLLVTVLAQPLFVAFLAISTIQETCAETMELLFRLIANACCGASVLHLCLISIDRCIVVLKPHNFREIITKKRLVFVLALAWLFPIIYAIVRLTISKRLTSYFTVVILALSVVIIIVCYALIVTTVRKQRRMSTRSRSRKSRDKMERRVTMTIAIVIVLFIVCWFPLIFLRSLRAGDNNGQAYDWARTLSLINSAMNPWIYCFKIRDFRAAYKRIFIKCNWEVLKGKGRNYTEGSGDRSSASYRKNSMKRPPLASGDLSVTGTIDRGK